MSISFSCSFTEGMKVITRKVVAKLKDGLSQVLEEFYQLAGKLARDEDGVFRIVYDDDIDGVEVLEEMFDHDGKDGDQNGECGRVGLKELTFLRSLMPSSLQWRLEFEGASSSPLDNSAYQAS